MVPFAASIINESSIFLGPLGLMIFALVPAIVVMGFSERWYGPLITRCTMVDVFLEAMCLILIPLGVSIFFIDKYLPMRPSCEERQEGSEGGGGGAGGFGDDDDLPPAWRYAFQAYIRAAALEELVKYCAVRRLLHKPYVVDARSLLVYGAVSGAAFGVIENVGYAVEVSEWGND
jgi:RsiW-degrading membrane proteinase PrsW (M82 family)